MFNSKLKAQVNLLTDKVYTLENSVVKLENLVKDLENRLNTKPTTKRGRKKIVTETK